jgi:hypothetical protein
MIMIQVSSSAIQAIGYDITTRRMKITFTEGQTYDFCSVPENVFNDLLHSNSKGRYYSDHIRDRYQC